MSKPTCKIFRILMVIQLKCLVYVVLLKWRYLAQSRRKKYLMYCKLSLQTQVDKV